MATQWKNDVDVESLGEDLAEYYNEYRKARKYANDCRINFESAMQSLASPGHKLVFNYQFGKLSVAEVVGTFTQDKPKASKPKESLQDWLAKQRSNGRDA